VALIGAHMSIAGGLSKAIERGEALKCEAIQIFTQSSRTWAIPPLPDSEVRLFQEALTAAKHVKKVVAHNSYLINLSTADSAVRKRSVDYFITTLERCEALGVECLITHPGSHLGAGLQEGIRATYKSLNEVMRACPGFRTLVVLENTAGQGDCIGHRFEELAKILEGVSHPERVGFCFDTQHAFAAGYDLRTPEAYEATFAEWDKHLSLDRIVAFHLNDSLKEIGARVDRHQNIGKGFLGVEAFRPLMNEARFAETPMCLETKPGDDDENWKKELKLLRLLRSKIVKQTKRAVKHAAN
jgi:deoxyribonuclease IV